MDRANIERKVGWFLILGATLFIIGMVLVSVRSDIFAKHFVLYVQPPTAASFYEGQSVKFQGFAIGSVAKIELLKQGEVRIHLKLLERYRSMLHQGATLQVAKAGLLGEQIASIIPGDIRLPMIQDGDTIDYMAEASLEQVLIELKPAVMHASVLFGELADLAAWMNNPYGDLRVAVAQLRDAGSGLHGHDVQQSLQALTEVLQKMSALAASFEDQQLASQLAMSLKQTREVLQAVKPLVDRLGQDGPATLQRINTLMEQVTQLSASMQLVSQDLSEMSPELPGMTREARAAIREMKGLVKSLQQSWLLGATKVKKKKGDAAHSTAAPFMEIRP